MTQNKAPTQIKVDDTVVHNPKNMADAFNNIFLKKVEKIRSKINLVPKIYPVQRLKNWLSRFPAEIPDFSLKEISKEDLRKIIKKMNGSRSHGIDFIDSFSLKLSHPILP